MSNKLKNDKIQIIKLHDGSSHTLLNQNMKPERNHLGDFYNTKSERIIGLDSSKCSNITECHRTLLEDDN